MSNRWNNLHPIYDRELVETLEAEERLDGMRDSGEIEEYQKRIREEARRYRRKHGMTR